VVTVAEGEEAEPLGGLVAIGKAHPRVRQFKAVRDNTKPNRSSLVAVEGLWELEQAVAGDLRFELLLVCPELFRGEKAARLATLVAASAAASYRVSEKVFSMLSDRDSSDGLAALAALSYAPWSAIAGSRLDRVVVLDGVESPGNLGTILRSAEAAGFAGAVMTHRRVRLSHPRLVHASMGVSLRMPIVDAGVDEAATWLRQHDYSIVTTDSKGRTSFRDRRYDGPTAIVLGNERHGVSFEWRDVEDDCVRIPIVGHVDSLNVGTAAALVLYECFHQTTAGRGLDEGRTFSTEGWSEGRGANGDGG
jgi:TrmH family RNA methyltransferase